MGVADDPIAPMLVELLRREGGYVHHRDDRGGATNWGITEAVARAHGWLGTMRDLPRDLALSIYRKRYWEQPRFDAVAEMSPKVAFELFDTGVNMGPGVAAAMLQRSLNALNRQQRDWPDVVMDRMVGPATLAALARLLAVRGKDGEAVLLKALNALKGARYIELAEARAANESFLYGWLAHRVA
jgi:lysozyme family protein